MSQAIQNAKAMAEMRSETLVQLDLIAERIAQMEVGLITELECVELLRAI